MSKLLNDVAFNKHSKQDGGHISPFGQGRVDVGLENITVRLVQGINEEAFRTVVGRSVMATNGIDPDNPPEVMPWEEMLKGGLQTALETQVVVFEVAGASRTLTHQLVRTRKASFHQQSQRAAFMGERPNVRMPASVERSPIAKAAFLTAVEAAREAYRIICEEDVSYQDARFILPEGTETYILCEYSLRTFADTYAYRGCSMFQWDHVYVMREMRRLLVEAHPWLDSYIKISCEKTGPAALPSQGNQTVPHHCTFQGWEEVEDQCDFPWAKEEARTYQPAKELKIG